VRQVCEIAGRKIGKPLVCIANARFVKQFQAVRRRLPFISHERRKECFVHRRHSCPPEFERGGIDVPLHGVAEEMGQQEQPLLGRDRAIDVDFGAVQIADQRIGNIARDHAHEVAPLDSFLDAGAEIREPKVACGGHGTII